VSENQNGIVSGQPETPQMPELPEVTELSEEAAAAKSRVSDEMAPEKAASDRLKPPDSPPKSAVTEKASGKSGGSQNFIKRFVDPERISGLAFTLFAISAAVALVLGAGNALTATVIEENRIAARNEALSAVFDADEFLPTDDTEKLYIAQKEGAVIGYAVQVAPTGYGGPIEMIVGVNPDLTISNVSLIKMSETPGYGQKMQTEDWFLGQFAGKSLPLEYDGEQLDAISGATITSDAVINGMRGALDRVADYLVGEGNAQ
jgi:electron transport complex protein RnfG